MDNNIKNMRILGLNKFDWISRFSPSFFIHGNQVSILKEPHEFYSKLQQLTNSSKRIILASLYYGTGHLEQRMIHNLKTALSKSENKDLKIKILIDYNRGSRGKINSRTMFLPLLQSYPQNLQVSLFHSPLLSGCLKRILPDRINEVMGLFHMKIYIGDDDIIISGANLSESYFTNRQDRYIHISKCSELSNYFDEVLSIVSKYSFQLNSNGSTTFNEDNGHPFKSRFQNKVFCQNLKDEINSFLEKWKIKSNLCDLKDTNLDTVLHPLIQMGPVGILQDEIVTTKFLSTLDAQSNVKIATGYFNLTFKYIEKIIRNNGVDYTIITAAPQANSFFQSSGISGYITDVYTCIVKSFYNKAMKVKNIGAAIESSNCNIPIKDDMLRGRTEILNLNTNIENKENFDEINKSKLSYLSSENERSLDNKTIDLNSRNEISNKLQHDSNDEIQCRNSRIKVLEYTRAGWTFHAKGLWYYSQNNFQPNLTFVGSSNFGCRSVERDMEAQLIIITNNKHLQNQLHEEQCNMIKYNSLVTSSTFKEKSRRVPVWISIVLPFISNFF